MGNSSMSPDFVWIKSRSYAYWHYVYDVVRGATKEIYTNATNAEDTDSGGLTSFDSNGFSLGSNICLLYTSPSPRDMRRSRMPSSA